jgi:hypothetical protein
MTTGGANVFQKVSDQFLRSGELINFLPAFIMPVIALACLVVVPD